MVVKWDVPVYMEARIVKIFIYVYVRCFFLLFHAVVIIHIYAILFIGRDNYNLRI